MPENTARQDAPLLLRVEEGEMVLEEAEKVLGVVLVVVAAAGVVGSVLLSLVLLLLV